MLLKIWLFWLNRKGQRSLLFTRARTVMIIIVTPRTSVIPFTAEILEKYLKPMESTVQCHDFMTPDQSAYLRNHFTLTAQHKVEQGWRESVNDTNGECFIDLSKIMFPNFMW